MTRERGFTLAEVLVALAIVAVIGGTLAQSVAQSAQAQRQIRARETALLVAQSALDRAAAGEPVSAGHDAGFTWQITRADYGTADPLGAAGLEDIRVGVAVPGARPLVTLATVRVRP